MDNTQAAGTQSGTDDPRAHRHYETTDLATLNAAGSPAEAVETSRREVLLKLYGEVCTSWRTLTDVRFKLLGLVPVVSGVLLINLLTRNEPGKGLSPVVQTGIAVFGLAVTLALWVYDRRNDQLYDDLISRGRKIEEELGIATGQFLGRLDSDPSKKLLYLIPVKHSVATEGVYGAAVLAWIAALLAIWLVRT